MSETPHEVIGIARASRYTSLGESPQPAVLRPLAQEPVATMALVVRSTSDPGSVLGLAQSALRDLEPSVPVPFSGTMRSVADRSLWATRRRGDERAAFWMFVRYETLLALERLRSTFERVSIPVPADLGRDPERWSAHYESAARSPSPLHRRHRGLARLADPAVVAKLKEQYESQE